MNENFVTFKRAIIYLYLIFEKSSDEANEILWSLLKSEKVTPVFYFSGYSILEHQENLITPYEHYYQCNFIKGFFKSKNLTDFYKIKHCREFFDCHDIEIYELLSSSFIDSRFSPIASKKIKPFELQKGMKLKISVDEPLMNQASIGFRENKHEISYSDMLIPLEQLYKNFGKEYEKTENPVFEFVDESEQQTNNFNDSDILLNTLFRKLEEQENRISELILSNQKKSNQSKSDIANSAYCLISILKTILQDPKKRNELFVSSNANIENDSLSQKNIVQYILDNFYAPSLQGKRTIDGLFAEGNENFDDLNISKLFEMSDLKLDEMKQRDK